MGLVGAVLVAVYPNTFRYDGMLLSESLVILTVLITVWLAYRYWHHPTRVAHGRGGRHGRAGRALAQRAGAVRAAAGPAAWRWLTPDASRRRRLRRAVLGVAACVAVLTPWVAFNLGRFDHTVLLSENIGGTLATSNCDAVYYGRLMGYWDYQCGQAILTAHHIGPYAFNGAADRDQFNGGLKYIEAHKGRVPVVVAARIGRITDLFHPRQQAHLDVYLENTTLVGLLRRALHLLPDGAAGGGRRRGDPPSTRPCCSRCWRRSSSVLVDRRALLRGHPVPGHRRRGDLPAGRGRRRCRAGCARSTSWARRGRSRRRPARTRRDRPWP